MLDGVTPVPAKFAARGKAGPVTYRELSDRSAHLARILLDEGFGPLDRIVVQLPNTAMFAYLYFALHGGKRAAGPPPPTTRSTWWTRTGTWYRTASPAS
jgi:acyl-CoA synthetase (AMP-forming)/AMP-acid ligase II